MSKERVIKFRVWEKVAKQMSDPFHLFGEFTLIGGVHAWQHEVRGESEAPSLEMLNDLVEMQFTGLHDKNGVEIYEGDVVKTNSDKSMVVDWSTRFASFVIKRDGWMFQHWFGEAMEGNECEVIGNIYQNPELLKP